MVFRLAFTGKIRKPSAVRTGFIKGTSFSTNSTTRTLPSGCREASKAVRGGNSSAQQIRPFLSATNFIMGLSHKSEPFQEQSKVAEKGREKPHCPCASVPSKF